MARARVLVIEDEADIRELLAFSLGKEGMSVTASPDAESGLAAMAAQAPDCLVLDVMLPGIDGLEALRRVKADPALKAVPVILATARGEEADVVAGLELGADDYVVKPYSPKVLAARIRATMRRAASREPVGAAAPASPIEHGGIRLDGSRHEVLAGGRRVELSATEFAVLELLLRSPGRVFTRSQIIDAVKGPDYPVTDRAVDVQVLSIRRKLGDQAEALETIRGVGYRARD
jgi:two-component system phosphate regulon response regulator PhoB